MNSNRVDKVTCVISRICTITLQSRDRVKLLLDSIFAGGRYAMPRIPESVLAELKTAISLERLVESPRA